MCAKKVEGGIGGRKKAMEVEGEEARAGTVAGRMEGRGRREVREWRNKWQGCKDAWQGMEGE